MRQRTVTCLRQSSKWAKTLCLLTSVLFLKGRGSLEKDSMKILQSGRERHSKNWHAISIYDSSISDLKLWYLDFWALANIVRISLTFISCISGALGLPWCYCEEIGFKYCARSRLHSVSLAVQHRFHVCNAHIKEYSSWKMNLRAKGEGLSIKLSSQSLPNNGHSNAGCCSPLFALSLWEQHRCGIKGNTQQMGQITIAHLRSHVQISTLRDASSLYKFCWRVVMSWIDWEQWRAYRLWGTHQGDQAARQTLRENKMIKVEVCFKFWCVARQMYVVSRILNYLPSKILDGTVLAYLVTCHEHAWQFQNAFAYDHASPHQMLEMTLEIFLQKHENKGSLQCWAFRVVMPICISEV